MAATYTVTSDPDTNMPPLLKKSMCMLSGSNIGWIFAFQKYDYSTHIYPNYANLIFLSVNLNRSYYLGHEDRDKSMCIRTGG